MMNNFILIMMFNSFAHFHCPPIFHESECQDAATRAGTAASEPSGSARQQRRGAAERRGAETKRGGARGPVGVGVGEWGKNKNEHVYIYIYINILL